MNFLGPAQILAGGQPVTAKLDKKELALLAYLAAQRDEISRDRAADLLWGHKDDQRARQNLRQALSNIRRLLPGAIYGPGHHVLALGRAAAAHTDLRQFDDLIRRGDLAAACVLYRGPLLDGLGLRDADGFEEWLAQRRAYYEQSVLEALSTLLVEAQRRSDNAALERHARHMLAVNPLKERATRALMLALGRQGHYNAALEAYRDCVKTLERELGVAPSAETAAVHERVLLARASPPRALPFTGADFVGRERELAEASARLRQPDCRLLTIIGLGGSGKTRLAVELARRYRSLFIHDLAYVKLDEEACSISEDGLLRSIADGLGLSTTIGQSRRQLVDYLRPREMLLVLDNFEQYVPVATVLGFVLKEAPDVRILVTSRERLDIPEEIVYPVGGMAYPPGPTAAEQASGVTPAPAGHQAIDPDTYDALTLFARAAGKVSPTFTLSTHIDDVIRLCQLVDGLPLAIELIAPWTVTETAAALATRLSVAMSQFINYERNFSERHRSLHAVFEYSWQRLTPMEQKVLRRLAVIAGPISLPAAEAITGATPSILRALADKSMIVVPEMGRYGLHCLMRAFALERLLEAGELPDAQEAHFHYFVNWIESKLPELREVNQRLALQQIAEEIGNIRAAWRYGIENATAGHLTSLMDGIYQFCIARTWYAMGLELSAVSKAALARRGLNGVLGQLVINEGFMHHHLGNYDQAGYCAEEGRLLCERERDNGGVARALFLSSTVHYDSNHYDQAEHLLIESFNLNRGLGNWEAVADLHLFLGHIIDYRTIYAPEGEARHKPTCSFEFEHERPTAAQAQGAKEAVAHFKEAQRLYGEIGHLFKLAWSRGAPGHPYYRLHQYDAALECYLEAAELFRQLDSISNRVHCLTWAGWVYHRQGQMAEARRQFQEALSQGLSILCVKKLLACLQKYSLFLWETERRHSMPLSINVFVAQHLSTDGRIRVEANEWVENITAFMRQEEGQTAVDISVAFGRQQSLAGLVHHLLGN